jgi:hypothetical protein
MLCSVSDYFTSKVLIDIYKLLEKRLKKREAMKKEIIWNGTDVRKRKPFILVQNKTPIVNLFKNAVYNTKLSQFYGMFCEKGSGHSQKCLRKSQNVIFAFHVGPLSM